MTEAEKTARIRELRAELKELQATPRSDWHSGFEALLRIEMYQYGNRVQIKSEQLLGENPPRADYLILVEEPGLRMDKAVFRIFRGQNIIEFKNPHDELNERVIRKICGYANFYIGIAEHEGDVPANEVTLSIFRAARPEKLFRKLLADGNLAADVEYKGIYYVKGLTDLPFQIVITSELEGTEYAAYRALTDSAGKLDVEQVILDGEAETEYALREHFRVFLELVARKNPDLIYEIRRDHDMEITWMDIFKDVIDERVQQGKQETWVADIRNVMESFGVSADKAMDVLKIPHDQRAHCAELAAKA